MLIKSVFALAFLLILTAIGWRYAGSDSDRRAALAAALPSVARPEGRPEVKTDGNGVTSSAVSPTASRSEVDAQAPGTLRGVRKCKKGASVIYTDQACPKGMQDLRVVERELTVLPGNPAPKSVKSPLQPEPTNEPSLRGRQMERVINQ